MSLAGIFILAGAVLVLGALYYFLYQRPAGPFPIEQRIDLGDCEIHYLTQGQGRETVLLIHGLGASVHCWSELVPLLAKKYRVIALDLPGFGNSSKSDDHSYGLDEQVDRLNRFLAALNIEKCFLVGNSMGANLALWLARSSPERFRRIVTIAPAAHPKLVPGFLPGLGFLSRPAAWMFFGPIAKTFHRRTLGLPQQLQDHHVQHSLSVYRKNPLAIRTLLSAMAAIRDERLLSENFPVKTLVLWGERDNMVPRWAIDKLMPRLPDATLVIHPEGGHQLQHDFPEWTSQNISNFFSARLDNE